MLNSKHNCQGLWGSLKGDVNCLNRACTFLVTGFLFLFSNSSWAADEEGRRVLALVIGNSEYQGISSLTNAGNDAQLISSTLAEIGVDSAITRYDLSRSEMSRTVNEFFEAMSRYDVGFVYYAGHGMQDEYGENYLVPVDFGTESSPDLYSEGFPTDRIFRGCSRLKDKAFVFFLDACRNNPYPSDYRSSGSGLGEPKVPSEGVLVGFSTESGKVAGDYAEQSNGHYATALSEMLKVPNMKAEDILKEVGTIVREKSDRKQSPEWWGNLSGSVILNFDASRYNVDVRSRHDELITAARDILTFKVAQYNVGEFNATEDECLRVAQSLDALVELHQSQGVEGLALDAALFALDLYAFWATRETGGVELAESGELLSSHTRELLERLDNDLSSESAYFGFTGMRELPLLRARILYAFVQLTGSNLLDFGGLQWIAELLELSRQIGDDAHFNMILWSIQLLESTGQIEDHKDLLSKTYRGTGIFVETKAGGVYITKVHPHTSAASVGLESGDLIRSVNGIDLKEVDGLEIMTAESQKSEEITLEIVRDETSMNMDVTIGTYATIDDVIIQALTVEEFYQKAAEKSEELVLDYKRYFSEWSIGDQGINDLEPTTWDKIFWNQGGTWKAYALGWKLRQLSVHDELLPGEEEAFQIFEAYAEILSFANQELQAGSMLMVQCLQANEYVYSTFMRSKLKACQFDMNTLSFTRTEKKSIEKNNASIKRAIESTDWNFKPQDTGFGQFSTAKLFFRAKLLSDLSSKEEDGNIIEIGNHLNLDSLISWDVSELWLSEMLESMFIPKTTEFLTGEISSEDYLYDWCVLVDSMLQTTSLFPELFNQSDYSTWPFISDEVFQAGTSSSDVGLQIAALRRLALLDAKYAYEWTQISSEAFPLMVQVAQHANAVQREDLISLIRCWVFPISMRGLALYSDIEFLLENQERYTYREQLYCRFVYFLREVDEILASDQVMLENELDQILDNPQWSSCGE